MTVTRYKLFRDSTADCFCDVDVSGRGSYVDFDEYERLRRDNERLQKAHDHQYEMAGLMLREAERYGRELAEARVKIRNVADCLDTGMSPRDCATELRLIAGEKP